MRIVGILAVALTALLFGDGLAADGPTAPSQRMGRWEMALSWRYQFAQSFDYAGGSTLALDWRSTTT